MKKIFTVHIQILYNCSLIAEYVNYVSPYVVNKQWVHWCCYPGIREWNLSGHLLQFRVPPPRVRGWPPWKSPSNLVSICVTVWTFVGNRRREFDCKARASCRPSVMDFIGVVLYFRDMSWISLSWTCPGCDIFWPLTGKHARSIRCRSRTT